MNIIRATFVICATILASVFGITYYSYQQDQFVVSSSGNYVAIFDKKTKTINMCDKGNCTLVTPKFPNPDPVGTEPQGYLTSQILKAQQAPLAPNGQRLLGSFPQPQTMPNNPQMMVQNQMGGNPQMNPQMMQPRVMMPPQMGNPQMMAQNQMGGNPQMNPQMMQQMQQRAMMPQQMVNPQMMAQPQMINATTQAAQAQTTGGAPAAANNGTDEANTDDAGSDDASTDDASTNADAEKTDDAGTTDDAAAPEEGNEENAPV